MCASEAAKARWGGSGSVDDEEEEWEGEGEDEARKPVGPVPCEGEDEGTRMSRRGPADGCARVRRPAACERRCSVVSSSPSPRRDEGCEKERETEPEHAPGTRRP